MNTWRTAYRQLSLILLSYWRLSLAALITTSRGASADEPRPAAPYQLQAQLRLGRWRQKPARGRGRLLSHVLRCEAHDQAVRQISVSGAFVGFMFVVDNPLKGETAIGPRQLTRRFRS